MLRSRSMKGGRRGAPAASSSRLVPVASAMPASMQVFRLSSVRSAMTSSALQTAWRTAALTLSGLPSCTSSPTTVGIEVISWINWRTGPVSRVSAEARSIAQKT